MDGVMESIQFAKWKLRTFSKLWIYFLSQVPLFEMDQEEDEEDVLSMKSIGKEEKFVCVLFDDSPFSMCSSLTDTILAAVTTF